MPKVLFWKPLSSTDSRPALTSGLGVEKQTTFQYLKGAGKAQIAFISLWSNTNYSFSRINVLYRLYTFLHILCDADNIFFPKSCFSSVGNRRVGKQVLSIGTNCDRIATIEHEFLHALGFWHEQSRSDRDDYVRIMWDYISEGTERLTVTCLL